MPFLTCSREPPGFLTNRLSSHASFMSSYELTTKSDRAVCPVWSPSISCQCAAVHSQNCRSSKISPYCFESSTNDRSGTSFSILVTCPKKGSDGGQGIGVVIFDAAGETDEQTGRRYSSERLDERCKVPHVQVLVLIYAFSSGYTTWQPIVGRYAGTSVILNVRRKHAVG